MGWRRVGGAGRERKGEREKEGERAREGQRQRKGELVWMQAGGFCILLSSHYASLDPGEEVGGLQEIDYSTLSSNLLPALSRTLSLSLSLSFLHPTSQ